MIDRRALMAAIAAALTQPAVGSQPAAAQGARASADDTARFLGGLTPGPGSPLERWTADAGWRSHAAEFNRIWARLETAQLAPIRAWSADYLGTKRPVLFYMFSGPDFLYGNAFFPEAETYVLSGLEPVGQVPEITESSRRAIGRLRSSLSSILNVSFFKTISMRSDFAGSVLGGTLPVLFVFLARSGKTITSAELVRLAADGTIAPADDPSARNQPLGTRIRFSDAERQDRTLYYFQVDVSNSGPHLAPFLGFCRGLGSGDAFVKSASYLMHNDSFSRIREFLLEHAQAIVEDDSGIPVRFFSADWHLIPFGRYLGPIPLFSNRYQPRLAEIFAKGRPEPLRFGVGYRYQRSESNLLLAIRKPARQ